MNAVAVEIRTRKTFSGKPGRKKASGPREPNGRAQRANQAEKEADILSVALKQPHRAAFGDKARDPKAGYVFGRLSLTKAIRPEQYEAGEKWTRLFVRHAKIMGIPMPSFPSIMAGNVAGGISHWEPEDEEVFKIRREFEDMNRELSDKLPGEYLEAQRALMGVCILDKEPDMKRLGVLRVALNVLARMWKIEK